MPLHERSSKGIVYIVLYRDDSLMVGAPDAIEKKGWSQGGLWVTGLFVLQNQSLRRQEAGLAMTALPVQEFEKT